MGVFNQPVYRHRLAIIEEYGYTAMQIPEDGFTDEYFEVIGNHAEGDPNRRLILRSDAMLRTRISWADDAERVRAQQAMEVDWRETIGEDTYARLQGLRKDG